MTKEQLLESYLINLSKKLNEVDYNTADKEHLAELVFAIKYQMSQRLNEHFREHFIDDLSDEEVTEFFESVKKGADEVIASLPVNFSD
jgi:Glu-tRNA(Gln) amidotransferase subunit E-like FAD-binding protein